MRLKKGAFLSISGTTMKLICDPRMYAAAMGVVLPCVSVLMHSYLVRRRHMQTHNSRIIKVIVMCGGSVSSSINQYSMSS